MRAPHRSRNQHGKLGLIRVHTPNRRKGSAESPVAEDATRTMARPVRAREAVRRIDISVPMDECDRLANLLVVRARRNIVKQNTSKKATSTANVLQRSVSEPTST